MASKSRSRYESESSNSSTDSSLPDSIPYHSIVDVESSVDLCHVPKAKVAAEDKGRNYQRIAIVSLVVSVVCFFTVIGGGCFWYLYVYGRMAAVSPTEDFSVPENEKVCMPCAEVSSSPFEEFESPISQQLEVTVGDDGESTCCAKTPAQYAALFKLILKRQEAVKKLADVLGSPRTSQNNSDNDDGNKQGTESVMDFIGGNAVSAHLLTKSMSPLFSDSEGRVMQQWKSPEESPVSHVRKGLKFHENKIYVQSPGLYFVYCQILYNRNPGDDVTHDSVASNYVKRHSLTFPSSSGILLKARHTSGQRDRHSSWVGGLFFLHAGDQLFVQVSIPELVSHDDTGSFFGLFKVGN